MPDVRSAVHIHDGDIELYALGRQDPEHASAVEAHLSECQTCQEQFSQTIGSQLNLHQTGRTKSKEKYKRSEPRFSAGDQAFLQELSPLSLDRQTVEIVDLSRNGLGIVAPKSVFPGTIVQVRIKSAVELGEVRHCSASGGAYRIGLRLHSLF
jgi:hypothetical protein